MEFLTISAWQTRKMGKLLAEEIVRHSSQKKAFVIGLKGELGGGKTTFVQGFAKGLRVKEKILSPTFVILKRFSIPHQKKITDPGQKFENFYHLDCYRIENEEEILDIGFKDIIDNPKNIIVIEWAERIKKILPINTLWIRFEFIDRKRRKIVIK